MFVHKPFQSLTNGGCSFLTERIAEYKTIKKRVKWSSKICMINEILAYKNILEGVSN